MRLCDFLILFEKISKIMDVSVNAIYFEKLKKWTWGRTIYQIKNKKIEVLFNPQLLSQSDDFIKSVIIHELVHCKTRLIHNKVFRLKEKIWAKRIEKILNESSKNHRLGSLPTQSVSYFSCKECCF